DDVHPAADVFAAGEGGADANKTSDGREDREHSQRHPHRTRRFMRNVNAVMISMTRTMVHETDVLARFMTRPITSRLEHRIVLAQTFIERGCMRFVSFTTRRWCQEFF